MPATIDEIRQRLRQINPISAKLGGEYYARKWIKSVEWEHFDVDQGLDKHAEALKEAGGNTPDFLVEGAAGAIIALNAQHMNIGTPHALK